MDEAILKALQLSSQGALRAENSDYLGISLKDLALILLNEYNEETVAYGVGIGILNTCGYLNLTEKEKAC